jgi:hypothetical protein
LAIPRSPIWLAPLLTFAYRLAREAPGGRPPWEGVRVNRTVYVLNGRNLDLL